MVITREIAREVRRLAGIVQATISLEAQGVGHAAYRRIKRRILERLTRHTIDTGVTNGLPATSHENPEMTNKRSTWPPWSDPART